MSVHSAEVIDRCKANGHSAFVAYLPVGFPDVQTSIDAAKTVVDAGADIVELGFPYSDPTMDGAVIQTAAQMALNNGLHRGDVFRAVEAVAETGAAVLVMTYYNPVFRYGVENFARDLANAGGAGLITPDLIPEEAGEWITAADKYGLDKVFLVAQTSRPERLKLTAEASRGFVYAASRMGVTGVQQAIDNQAQALVERTRAAGAERVCMGIGVSDHDQAVEVGAYADGVIVGSALVKALLDHLDDGDGLKHLAATARSIADGAHTLR